MNVTILGGTGLLGQRLGPLLAETGHMVTITGRSLSTGSSPGLGQAVVDLATGEGLEAAIGAADCVVHLASDFTDPQKVDVGGTARLLDVIGDRHLLYLSIVGVDRHPLPYYQAKLAAETMIESAGGAHTIVRATQFHDLIDHRIRRMTRSRVGLLPKGYLYQPIEAAEVAAALAGMVGTGPKRRAPDLAGPEVLGMRRLAETWMRAVGDSKPLLEIPRVGASARAYRAGALTNPGRATGRMTWGDYLDGRYPR